MKVSVVIPTFNNAAYIGQAVDSVLHQSYRDMEIIVVDDGSTDDTKAILSKFGKSITYIYQENKSAPVARNTGIEAANGEYVAFLDSDDIWERHNLGTKMTVFRENPDLGAVFSDFSIFFGDGRSNPAAMRSLYPIFTRQKARLSNIFDDGSLALCTEGEDTTLYKGNVFKPLLHGNFIMLSSVVARKEAIVDAGAFDESLMTQQDYDLFLRLSRQMKWGFIDSPLVRYRRHDTQLTARRHTVRIIETVSRVLEPYFNDRDCILNDEEALRFSHRYADVFVQLGLAQLGNRRPQEARFAFRKALGIAPARLRRVLLWAFSQMPPAITHDFVKIARRLPGIASSGK